MEPRASQSRRLSIAIEETVCDHHAFPRSTQEKAPFMWAPLLFQYAQNAGSPPPQHAPPPPPPPLPQLSRRRLLRRPHSIINSFSTPLEYERRLLFSRIPTLPVPPTVSGVLQYGGFPVPRASWRVCNPRRRPWEVRLRVVVQHPLLRRESRHLPPVLRRRRFLRRLQRLRSARRRSGRVQDL